MAETEERSLDDFFAKRDKKKRKEKSSRGSATVAPSSAASSNAPVAGVTGGSRQAEGAHGAASNANAATGTAKAANKEEDDWKEFEQEEIIDYSGLRVQSMQISEKEEEESDKKEEPRDNSEEPAGSVEKSSGPWNRSAPTQIPVAEIIENPEPVQSSGVYRPPGAREGRTRKVPQGPPEIYSDTQFPSLQSTAKQVDTRKRLPVTSRHGDIAPISYIGLFVHGRLFKVGSNPGGITEARENSRSLTRNCNHGGKERSLKLRAKEASRRCNGTNLRRKRREDIEFESGKDIGSKMAVGL